MQAVPIPTWAAALAVGLIHCAAQAQTLQHRLDNQWPGGLQASVTLSNTTGNAIGGWRVEFDYPHAIHQVWNATLVSRVGQRYTIAGPPWASQLPAGAQASFGFLASAQPGVTAAMGNCTVNGTAPSAGNCVGAGNTTPTSTPTTAPATTASTTTATTTAPTANRVPTARANGPYRVAAQQALTLSAAGSADPDGRIVSYQWTLGDGSSQSTTTPSMVHTYRQPGLYKATVRVTDDRGAASQSSTFVTVTAAVAPPSTTTSSTSTTIVTTAGSTTVTTPAPNTPVAANGALRVCGNQLCNERGKAIQLRGISGHGLQWFAGCYAPAALDALATDWGADAVRVALYVQEGGYETDPAGYRARIDQLIEEISRRGMYVVLDWHIRNPGNPHANLDRAREFFEHVVAQHGHRQNLIYEIANEPNGVSWSEIRQYADAIIPVIRAKAPLAVVIVGTRGWSSLGVSEGSGPQEILQQPVNATNVMYAFHFYAGSHGQSYRDALALAAARLPIFVTEFGLQDYSGDGAINVVSSQAYIDLMARLKISWLNWNFSDDYRSSATLHPGSCSAGRFTGPALKESGTWIRERMLSPADDF